MICPYTYMYMYIYIYHNIYIQHIIYIYMYTCRLHAVGSHLKAWRAVQAWSEEVVGGCIANLGDHMNPKIGVIYPILL